MSRLLDLKVLAKEVLSQLHTHSKSKPDIFLFTLPRSGSTLLTEIINLERECKIIGEPFSLINGSSKVIRKYIDENSIKERYTSLTTVELNFLLCYLNDLSKGVFWNSYYWSDLFTKSHSYSTNRSLFKTQKITYYYKEVIDHFPEDFGLYLLRHPAAVSLSRARNNWEPYIDQYIKAPNINGQLTKKQKKLVGRIKERCDTFLLFILSWCLENFCFLQDVRLGKCPDSILTIYYEDIIMNPRESLLRICKHTHLDFNEKMVDRIRQPSNGVTHSSIRTINEIESNNKDYILNNWKKNISIFQIEEMNRIFDAFNVPYLENGCPFICDNG